MCGKKLRAVAAVATDSLDRSQPVHKSSTNRRQIVEETDCPGTQINWGASPIWTIDVPDCDRSVETDVFGSDGDRAFSAGQYLLEEEHQGAVEQFIPTEGAAQIQTTCRWSVTVP